MCSATADVRARPAPARRRPSQLQRQQRRSLLLDSATTAYVLHYLYRNPSYLNPWNLPNVQLWILGFVLIRCGIVFYDNIVVFVIEKCLRSKVLPTREPGAPPVRYVDLDRRSYVYLALGALNEYAFVMRLTHYLWQGGHQQLLPWKLTQLTVGNTVVALGIMFLFQDLLYAPLHHLLHMPALYPLIHKHHHRQHFPTRGYLDAGNEHPIEHMIGIQAAWFGVCASEVFLPTLCLWFERVKANGMHGLLEGGDAMTRGGGVHAATVLVFFQFHAALAMLNHSPFDVNFSLPFVGSGSLFGADNKVMQWLDETATASKWLKRIVTGQWFKYSVGHHEMHHRKFNYNYGQYCMLYDTLMGTFLAYEGPMTAAEMDAKKKRLSKKET
ncbi:hypothetical protein ACHAXT_010193 [Thalassiosira profunda]